MVYALHVVSFWQRSLLKHQQIKVLKNRINFPEYLPAKQPKIVLVLLFLKRDLVYEGTLQNFCFSFTFRRETVA